MKKSKSDLLSILPTTSAANETPANETPANETPANETSVDCMTARKKIQEILEKYPKERLYSLSKVRLLIK